MAPLQGLKKQNVTYQWETCTWERCRQLPWWNELYIRGPSIMSGSPMTGDSSHQRVFSSHQRSPLQKFSSQSPPITQPNFHIRVLAHCAAEGELSLEEPDFHSLLNAGWGSACRLPWISVMSAMIWKGQPPIQYWGVLRILKTTGFRSFNHHDLFWAYNDQPYHYDHQP